jgi:hypothetical protein
LTGSLQETKEQETWKKKIIQEPKYLFNLRKKEHLSVDNSKARQVYQRAFLVDAVVNFTQNISNTQNK